jgi:hypothetical protein
MTEFVPHDKFGQKLESWKICVCYQELDSFPTPEDKSSAMGGDSSDYNSGRLNMKHMRANCTAFPACWHR